MALILITPRQTQVGKSRKRVDNIQKSVACAIEEGLSGGTTLGSYDKKTPLIRVERLNSERWSGR